MSSSAQLVTASSLRGISLDRRHSHPDESQTHPAQLEAIHGTLALVPPKSILLAGPPPKVSNLSTDGQVMNSMSSIQSHPSTIHHTPSSSIYQAQAQHTSTTIPVPTTTMQSISHLNWKRVGTPRAIGALRNRSPALLHHLATPIVAHSATSRLNVDKKLPSPIFPITTEPNSDCKDSDNESTNSNDTRASKEFKAQLVLNVTRAQRDVRLAEKTLADSVLKQNVALGKLYEFEATEAERKLEDADIDIGYVHHSVRKSGITLLEDFASTSKPRKYHRKSTSHIDSDMLSPEVDLACSPPLAGSPSATPSQTLDYDVASNSLGFKL
ncbi:uncharacterized protein F5147DRAFT_771942 [Suillus discolor]|uniref:Uncharacterized protein n=1 Tax=Suillus discolor TaxID=1912936 RepID=A0A9P7FA52_9AGAM|nr:uncharacterized protein F5147DRAFT_771942 [Suillus discolor]KAG2111213.1 hypothetical protein F5147DRAFT_771942 [Suillus discolor]